MSWRCSCRSLMVMMYRIEMIVEYVLYSCFYVVAVFGITNILETSTILLCFLLSIWMHKFLLKVSLCQINFTHIFALGKNSFTVEVRACVGRHSEVGQRGSIFLEWSRIFLCCRISWTHWCYLILGNNRW